MNLLLAIDWSVYFGGWDMAGLLAACAAGASQLAPLVAAELGIFTAGAIVAFVRELA